MKISGLYRTTRELGLRATARYAIARARQLVWGHFDARFDRCHCVDTAGLVDLASLEIASANSAGATWYEATPVAVIRQLLDALPIRYEDYTFIDCGSGKGRPMLVASEYPFARILGVEFSPELHAIAERNIRSYRNPRQRCFRLESICEDAASYRWPDEPSVVFLFSPFQPPLFEEIVRGMLGSLRERPRSLYLVYYGAMEPCIRTLRETGLECREVKVRPALAARSRKRIGLILHDAVGPPPEGPS